jgi:hypothetical protein
MKAIFYLVRRTVANYVLDIIRKPLRVVIWLVILGVGGLAGFLLTRISPASETIPEDFSIDSIWLKGVLFLALIGPIVMSVATSFMKSSALFQMSAVNLLFTAPLNPHTVLFYAMIQRMITTVLSGVFVFFFAPYLNLFGFPMRKIGWVALGYLLTMIVLQLATLLIYSLVNSEPRRKNTAKVLTAVFLAPLVVAIGVYLITSTSPRAGLRAFLESALLDFYPVIGWASGGTFALLEGRWLTGTLCLGLIALLGVVLIVAMRASKPDFYESAIVRAETLFEKQRILEDGNYQEFVTKDKKVNIRGVGLFGRGAQVFLAKHIRVAFRENRLGFWGLGSLFYLGLSIAMALLLRDNQYAIIWILVVLFMIQTVAASMGKGLWEVYHHHIFLIPQPAIKKLLWSNTEYLVKTIGEAIVMFSAIAIILRNPAEALAGFAVYTLCVFAIIGTTFFSVRWVSGLGPGLQLLISYAIMTIGFIPGIIAAVLLGVFLGIVPALIALAIWELVLGIASFAASQGVFDRMDLQSVQEVMKKA